MITTLIKDLNLCISNIVLLKSDSDLVPIRDFKNFKTKGTSSRIFTSTFGKEKVLSKKMVCDSDDFF